MVVQSGLMRAIRLRSALCLGAVACASAVGRHRLWPRRRRCVRRSSRLAAHVIVNHKLVRIGRELVPAASALAVVARRCRVSRLRVIVGHHDRDGKVAVVNVCCVASALTCNREGEARADDVQ
jgi:hypothetical protein